MTTEKQAPAVDVIPDDGMQRWRLAQSARTREELLQLLEQLAPTVAEVNEAYAGDIRLGLLEFMGDGEVSVAVEAYHPTAGSFAAGLVLGLLVANGFAVSCVNDDFWPEVHEDLRETIRQRRAATMRGEEIPEP